MACSAICFSRLATTLMRRTRANWSAAAGGEGERPDERKRPAGDGERTLWWTTSRFGDVFAGFPPLGGVGRVRFGGDPI